MKGQTMTDENPNVINPPQPAEQEQQEPAAPQEQQPPAHQDEQQPRDEHPQPPHTEHALGAREAAAIERFGISADDLAPLGQKGAALAARLADLHAEIGRRYSSIGRAAKSLNPEHAAGGTMPTDANRTAPDIAGELDSLRRQVADLVRNVGQNRQSSEQAAVERFAAALDADDYPQFAGEAGKVSREQLAAKAEEIRRGHQIVHGSDMDFEESLKEALSIICADTMAAAQRRKIAADIRRRNDSRIARAAGRSGTSSESPLQRAVEQLKQWEREKGVEFFER